MHLSVRDFERLSTAFFLGLERKFLNLERGQDMKLKNLSVLILGLIFLDSCREPTEYILFPKSITMTADPGTIATSQNLKLAATVIFEGSYGIPEDFSVRFSNGTEILVESAISRNKTTSKDIPVTKAMNGTLTIKARVFRTNSTDTAVESQPVTVTVNIP
jgi:hypothetical protein